MTLLRVESFTISLDGFGAGLGQTLDKPMGEGGQNLHGWAFRTPTFQRMVFGKDGGEDGVDEQFAKRGFENVGAWIMGRNMFTPSRGPWPDDGWRGWWGEEPPYHCDVYVFSHYPREPLQVGETRFIFTADPIEDVLEQAKASAGDKDVRLGGGASIIRDYLRAGLIDRMHIAISPVLLGQGEPLLTGLDLPALGYEVIEHAGSPHASHVVFGKRG